ncbi:MAG: hypothetical protein RLZZ423_662 [Cyanobacteriota bacterium]
MGATVRSSTAAVNRGRAPLLDTLLMAGLQLGGLQLLASGPGLAMTPDRMPAPPASPVERHDPDPLTCQPDAMVAAWQRQLEPFRDQPPAVQQRLRELQRELAIGSLNRCIERGLLSRSQARELAVRMGLEAANATADQAPSQRP